MQLWEILVRELGVDSDLVDLLRNMYFDTVGIVASNSDASNATFKANIGVK